MTKEQLIKKLEPFPNNMEVVLEKTKTEFGIGEIETVEKRKIGFSEDPNSKPLCKDECIVLSDEF